MFQNSENHSRNQNYDLIHQNQNLIQNQKSTIISDPKEENKIGQNLPNFSFDLGHESNAKEEPEFLDKKSKQCNRWVVSWTIQEDYKLFEKYIKIGSRWVELTKFFPEKSDNAIKNRFYCCMRKVQRRMNKVQKQKKLKYRKPISYDSLLTIMEIGKYIPSTEDKRFHNIRENIDNILELRKLIVQIARQPEESINDEDVKQLIIKFFELKFSLKFINIQRVKKSGKKIQQDRVSQSMKESEVQVIASPQEKEGILNESTAQSFGNHDIVLDDIIFKEDKIPELLGKADPKPCLFSSCQEILKIDPHAQNFDHLFFI